MFTLTPKRLYQEVGDKLKAMLTAEHYPIGSRLPPERDIAQLFSVSRSVVRESLIMLELENLVRVKKGSGVYVVNLPSINNQNVHSVQFTNDIGPFELLQARQLLESNIAAFAASQIVKNDITEMRAVLQQEERSLNAGAVDYEEDELFHRLIAKATQNSILEEMVQELWQKRKSSPMWEKLHARIIDHTYRKAWLNDHQKILQALQLKDSQAAYQAMWQHLENVKETLMQLSDPDDPYFDGHLFLSIPATKFS